MNISPLACVSENALIGKDVKIGPFVTIDENVVIGDGTIIDSNAVIHSGARIGNNCHIHSGAVVSDIPQDLKFKGEDSVAIIGDNTSIREFVTIHRGTASKGKTVIGDNCLIMAYCHVAHDCELGNNVIMSNQVQLAGEVVVGDYAVLGGGALVHQFTHIGKHVMLQGGSLVNKDLPPYIMAGRYPISYEGVNSVGLHRRGFTEEQITKIQKVYRVLYLSRLNNTEALAKVIAEIPQSPERDEIVNFVKASKRGIVRMGI
ncbi:MAG: acyl-ACP--UDP-N-acetylglucosamine O-acyltransferase [Muribaculaceae bacterium]|jgi:UDP-N-acetylglucosamine acyltransferase|nr:acyl-ACP--UDP-N-acetylglucosamine O-acyltransferase [Muribaculaceae bacterium]MBQ3910141.1 acyl-ACP--UDP-N-acetylglucosamine O-acyltransferase [Muribaculaceae bacterium]MBQ6648013.1 acyl-ACP--UDP-N-acetylglucosamine O-acyltransferase [Muribaculaceae bacterium]